MPAMKNNQPEKSNDQKSEGRRSLLRDKLPLEHETAWFILVNALDVFMTYLLLRTGEFRESNGIANWFLMRYGIRGMVYFKFVLVAFVSVIAQVVARKRLETGKWLLNIGTMLVGAVVIYSFFLLMRARFGG